jgi:ribulose-5-phosphate 4-epimerase/fuculose-1-phosphate aldolase
MTESTSIIDELIKGARILHHHDVFNESGTISVRNPTYTATFFVTNKPAILLSSPQDISELAIHPTSPSSAMDRATLGDDGAADDQMYLHAAIYARSPSVKCIVHTCASDFIVFGLCEANGSMTRSVFNKAGFVNEFSPIFNPTSYEDLLPPTHPKTLKIDHPILGDALAAALAPNEVVDGGSIGQSLHLPHRVALIRGNGAVLWGEKIEQAVFNAVMFKRNATIQTSAMLQRIGSELDITYLNTEEQADSEQASRLIVRAAWNAWSAEIDR